MKEQVNKQMLITAGVCGLYCKSCTSFIGTTEDPKRLELLAQRSGYNLSDIYCEGCRSDRISSYCRKCAIKECANNKSIDFCSECHEYPCELLKDFQVKLPHRIELFDSLNCMKEFGLENWTEKMNTDYSCMQCATINSAYDLKCRACGSYPGNEFVKKHSTEILSNLRKKSL